MKRILFISALFIWTSLNAQVSRDDYLADFDYGVDMVETIYSGFDYKVTDCTRTSYFALKDSLRTAIANNQTEFGEAFGGIRPSYLMVKAGSWGRDAAQLHRFFGWEKAKVDMGCPFSIEADDCLMSETFTKGSVEVSVDDSFGHPEWMCQSGSMSWNLSIGKKTAFNVGYGAGKLFRSLQLFEMFWHAEGMATA